jgi:serine/threonine-protein phosphatase PGAM5
VNLPPTRRHLYFIRHGQYESRPDVFGGVLTALGRRQARKTGKRLAKLPIKAVFASDLQRAVESAEIIAEQVDVRRVRIDSILREQIATAVKGMRVPLEKRRKARKCLDDIEAKFFVPSRSLRHEVVVCHGNLIRELVCRVLGVRLGAWVNMNVTNGGVTHIKVLADGMVRLVGFNDIGHMPDSLVTET